MGEIFHGKRVMHIDTSVKFYENKDTAIAFKILSSGKHKGLTVTNRMKRQLDRDLNMDQEYAVLYAICIEALIEKDLGDFDVIVICGDESPTYVKEYLDKLFQDNKEWFAKKRMSIGELRELTGVPKLRSQADKIASIYRNKASKPPYRQQRGISLNVINLGYEKIVRKWKFLHRV